MKFDSYITSGTKTASTVKNYTEFVNKTDFNKKRFSLKKAAFTLAETLITLTIIGVIAALTIPNLISSYQKHTYVVGLKKAYSQLQNAMKMIPITQGCPAGDYDCVGWNDEWRKATNIEGQEFNGILENKRTYLLSKQFKITNLCYRPFTNNTICEKNAVLPHPESYHGYFITEDGMHYGYSSYGEGIGIFVDINGVQNPNKMGRDQFSFDITNLYDERYYGIPQGTVVPRGSKLYADINDWPNSYWRNGNYCTTERVNKGDWVESCTGRVLEEDAMNY